MIMRRDILVAGVAASLTIGALALAQSPAKAILNSSVFDWAKMAATATKYGEKRDVVKSPTATADQLDIHVTTVNPGQRSHEPHRHPEEEVIIVKEGTIESMQEGVTTKVGPGSVIFEASNQLHGLANGGDTPATYLVIKWWTPGTLQAKPE
ncbi:MAG TPA: cupin domain-containing protein [Lacipirellulaceae bacterium]|jgi:quercetin dioxygenase-like cupin family protein